MSAEQNFTTEDGLVENKPEQELKLTDLIDQDTLQLMQDTFSKTFNIAVVITNADGSPVTKSSRMSNFCYGLTRSSEYGRCMCEECDRFGAEESLRTGHNVIYTCHTGLTDFAAPIKIGDKLVGGIVGGQILAEKPDEDAIRTLAGEFGVDSDEYWKAVQEIPVIEEALIKNAAEFLESIAGILSKIAYGKYLTQQANIELANAAKLQSDFLANMSHEIRTPMNAVIGFAEMALREDLPKQARGYIEQIKTSGNSLLSIINDILDFSKIESGKMEIIPVEYEPLSLIEDVANIVMTRLVDKNVELLLDVSPNIPSVLYGDNNRLRQILINICNNATKFTNSGHVKIVVTYEWASYEDVYLDLAVEDTGIGIRKEDLEKIFVSFQQVDTKRNRNVEGTGLGLTICRNLLKLMDSDLVVESEYGVGSRFSFRLKQHVVDPLPSIIVNECDKFCVAGAFSNRDVEDDFVNDASKLGIIVETMHDLDHRQLAVEKWAEKNPKDKVQFFFVEQSLFDPELLQHIDSSLGIHLVIIVDTFADVRAWSKYKDILILRKPVSVLNLGTLLNHRQVISRAEATGDAVYNFTAEDAKVLVVDDNVVNLTVAQGLMEPLKMHIDTATSGKEAIRMARIQRYDLILMDHMMPEMDGIEATHILREQVPDYTFIPIIALTANAVADARAMFKDEGMDDFVAKPIEVRSLLDCLRKHLPQEKIKKGESYREAYNGKETEEGSQNTCSLADLDVESAVSMLGSEKLFKNILKIYYESIDSKAAAIRKLYEDKNWPEYAIEVHALKSSSRQIGAMELGDLAYTLEMAGKNEDVYTIERDTDRLLEKYLSYRDSLRDYCTAGESTSESVEKPEATKEKLKPLFGRLRVAIDDLDMDEMENIIAKMDEFSYSVYWQDKYDSLKSAVSDMDVERCIVILDNWL